MASFLFDSLAQRIQGTGIPVVIELAKGIAEIADQVTAYEQPLKQFMETPPGAGGI